MTTITIGFANFVVAVLSLSAHFCLHPHTLYPIKLGKLLRSIAREMRATPSLAPQCLHGNLSPLF